MTELLEGNYTILQPNVNFLSIQQQLNSSNKILKTKVFFYLLHEQIF